MIVVRCKILVKKKNIDYFSLIYNYNEKDIDHFSLMYNYSEKDIDHSSLMYNYNVTCDHNLKKIFVILTKVVEFVSTFKGERKLIFFQQR